VVEVAIGLAPGPLEHLVTRPERLLIEEFHEGFERGGKGRGTGTHGGLGQQPNYIRQHPALQPEQVLGRCLPLFIGLGDELE